MEPTMKTNINLNLKISNRFIKKANRIHEKTI